MSSSKWMKLLELPLENFHCLHLENAYSRRYYGREKIKNCPFARSIWNDVHGKGEVQNFTIELGILDTMKLVPKLHRSPWIWHVKCLTPPKGWWKVDTNAFVAGSPISANCGGMEPARE